MQVVALTCVNILQINVTVITPMEYFILFDPRILHTGQQFLIFPFCDLEYWHISSHTEVHIHHDMKTNRKI